MMLYGVSYRILFKLLLLYFYMVCGPGSYYSMGSQPDTISFGAVKPLRTLADIGIDNVGDLSELLPASFPDVVRTESARVRTNATDITIDGKKYDFHIIVGRVAPKSPTTWARELEQNGVGNPRAVVAEDIVGLVYTTMLSGYICVAGPFARPWTHTDIFDSEQLKFKKKPTLTSNPLSEAIILTYARGAITREIMSNDDLIERTKKVIFHRT